MAIAVSQVDDAQVPDKTEVKQVIPAADIEVQEQQSCVGNGSVTSLVIVS